MAVLQMQRISLCALKKDRKAILETLQRRGVVEISDVALEENDNFFQKSDTVQAKQGLTGMLPWPTRPWMCWILMLLSKRPCFPCLKAGPR